jgi:hypothetical protein
MTVHFRVKFTLADVPRTALLTDRGWTVIHDAGAMAQIFNHICPPPTADGPVSYADCAAKLAELFRGTAEPA